MTLDSILQTSTIKTTAAMSTAATTTTTTVTIMNPMNQPEILDLIARWLPTWKQPIPSFLDLYTFYDFGPGLFVNCLRVSKLWYQCFLPHFWHFYFDYHMCPDQCPSLDPEVFQRHLPLMRRHWYYSCLDSVLPFSPLEVIQGDHVVRQEPSYSASHLLPSLPPRQLLPRPPMPTNLLGLLVEAAPTMTMARLLTINAVNLRELHWKGQVRKWWDQDRKRMSTLPEEVVLAMKQLRSLQVLSLCNWHIPTRDFYEILASCQETLHYLTLKSISGFKVKRPGSLPLSDNQVAQYHQSLHHDPVTSPPSAATEEEPDAGLDSNWNEFAFSDLFAESDSESDSESEIESSPRFRLHRLKELELCLDWTQSDSSVYLPQFCPGLESIKVNVNTDQKDLLGMIDTLRLSCPGLKQVHYKEGCSMAHEYGYFPPSEIYNSLIEDCTRPLSSFREKDSRGRKDLVQAMATTTITSGATDMDKSTISNSSALIESSRQPPTLEARTTLSGLHIGLEDGLTEAITTSILVNAATLETIQLRFRDRGDGPESMRWIQRILQSCPSLKNVQFDDVYYVLEDLDILFRPPALSLPDSSGVRPDWVCKGLESFSLQGTDRNWQSGRDRESLKRWKILQSMIQPWFVGGQTKYDCGKVFCFVLSQCPNLRWMRLNRTQFSMRPFHRSEFEDKVLEDDDQDEEDEVEND